MGYAFISYSTKNKASADALRELFRKNNIDTWMAPYSIPIGSDYPSEITKAIRDCSCFVLLLSKDSQESEGVNSEVQLAKMRFKKKMIFIEIEKLTLNDSFEFYISNTHYTAIHKFDEKSQELKAVLGTVQKYAGVNVNASVSKEMDKSTVKPLEDFVKPTKNASKFKTEKDIIENNFEQTNKEDSSCVARENLPILAPNAKNELQKLWEVKVVEIQKYVREKYPYKSVGYIGDMVDEKRHGYGIDIWESGETYIGEWRNGERHGIGKRLNLLDGEKRTDENATIWIEGLPMENEYYFADGSLFTGEFNNSKPYLVKIIYKKYYEGEIYEGYIVNGVRHGKGTLTKGNDWIYEGDFFENKRQGKGKLYFNDALYYEGDFYNDKYHGFGILKRSEDNVYTGEFRDGEYDGNGKLQEPNGCIYEGQFIKGITNGRGKISYPDGSYYIGNVYNNYMHGYGKLCDAEGNKYCGTFVADKKNGKFYVTLKKDDREYTYIYRNDRLILKWRRRERWDDI